MMNNYSDDTPVVLLVEDELLVRMAAAEDLQDAGFHVLEAANADVALAVLEACSHDVQVLFTDIDMPGTMNGLDLAENVQQRWPHISLLISSAYHKPLPEQIPDDGRFVPKPYSSEDVVKHIRELVTSH
ncbi:response regulator [Microvirga lotononidis]|uniref:Response regulator with CheY-like receiver, AAA-type ATPase, and DNA-binding domains n=2 Tax=Microvirga lotononidis TaxID=864069 RepID=I4YLW1_9HYPH|nr:response regulator [Microvirga lotononidis]EIM24953.1 response regulator with CheY-like receiver, AAA-type ATPase, and DNA-binding domains [Microvirga lotononidis]